MYVYLVVGKVDGRRFNGVRGVFASLTSAKQLLSGIATELGTEVEDDDCVVTLSEYIEITGPHLVKE